MKRITMFLLSIILVLSTFSFQTQGSISAVTEEISDRPEESQNGMDESVFQAGGVRAFGILYEEYLDERLISQTKDELKIDFYQYYAGAYLDDGGALTVYYKSAGEDSALEVKRIIEKKADCIVTFEPVLYSYQELLAFREELYEISRNWEEEGHKNWYDAIQGVGISQKDNCILIKLDTLSKEEMKKLESSLSMIV